MKKKQRSHLIMRDNYEVRDIEELKKYFHIEKILYYYKSGELKKWLEERYYDYEIEKLALLNSKQSNLIEELCAILDVVPPQNNKNQIKSNNTNRKAECVLNKENTLVSEATSSSNHPISSLNAEEVILDNDTSDIADEDILCQDSDEENEIVVDSPMPGKISKIIASEGACVSAGDTLLILDALKMKNEITAPYDGVVKKVLVSINKDVQAGEELVVLCGVDSKIIEDVISRVTPRIEVAMDTSSKRDEATGKVIHLEARTPDCENQVSLENKTKTAHEENSDITLSERENVREI